MAKPLHTYCLKLKVFKYVETKNMLINLPLLRDDLSNRVLLYLVQPQT